MSELSDFLVESILNEAPEKVVALFGGGFKPPTKGHLEVVNTGLQQNPEVTEIKILVGGGERDGFTQSQSVKIWNLYNDLNLISKPATIIPVTSPFTYYKNYLKDNPEDKVYVFIGSRPGEEKDQFDVKQRSEFVKKYSDNVVPVEVATGGGVSGTLARKLFNTDLDGFRNMFPENLIDSDWKKILNILGKKDLNEGDPKKGTGKKPKGSSRRLYTDEDPKDTVGVKFSTRQDIVDTLNKKSFKAKSHARQSQIINLIHQRTRAAYNRAKKPDVKKRLKTALDYITDRKEASKRKTQRMKKENIDPKAQSKHKGKAAPFGSAYEPLNENATYSNNINYKKYIKELTTHMLNQGMKLTPLPKVIFKNGDKENAENFFGKTAYYNPETMEIVLYTEGRHPKDIVRSFAHEMIHHRQNLEGNLGGINTTNTQEDDYLTKIEAEAYQDGNLAFRGYTDTVLNEDLSNVSLDYIKTKLPKLDSYPKSDIILTKEDFVYVSIPQNPNNPFRMVYEIKVFDIKDGTLVAQSSFDYDDNNKLKGTLDVRPDKRRKGIATTIYTLAEKKIGDIIYPEEKHTDAAEKFWQQKNRSFGPKINEKKNKDPFGLNQYARELVKEVFNKTVTIDMDPIIKALEFEMPTGQETDENAIAIIDAAPQGKVSHPVFLDFYAKFDKYFGEENDDRMLDNFGLEHLLSNVLNLPSEDIQIVMNHYNTTDQDSVEWFEQHDNELERDEEYNIPGFDDANDDYESVVNYRRKQLAKSLEEQERVRIFNKNCGCDKTKGNIQ